MTLATRCPSCGTVFRVVQDQLRVSEGWVRCGRCNGVFDATEVLFDIDTGTPVSLLPAPDEAPPSESLAAEVPPTPPAAAPPPSSAPAPAPASPPPEPYFTITPDWTDHGPVEPRFAEGPPLGPADAVGYREEPLLRAPSRSGDDASDERIVITDHVGADDRPLPDAAVEPALGAAPPAPVPVQAPPSFMQAADRAALWRRPVVRAGLWVGVLLLGLGALLQMALLWRDHLATAWPAAKPALQALCRVAGCSVQPLRRIESLAVDSSALNRLDGSSLYRLQLVLRNRADTAVMMPSLDLLLTDAQGRPVARRVLTVAELGVTQAALLAGQQLPIKVLVSTGERRVDGYTLELFYP